MHNCTFSKYLQKSKEFIYEGFPKSAEFDLKSNFSVNATFKI